MKLQSITLCDFRAFPGKAEYKFDFGKKNHLLIYGENGSGKSSVFKALHEFFDVRSSATSFHTQKNFFSDQVHGEPLTCGKVSLEFDPQQAGQIKTSIDWSFQPEGTPDNRPIQDITLLEVARRKGMLDYLSLVKVNLTEKDRMNKDQRPNLFGIMIERLLFDFPVSIAGGQQIGLGGLWLKVQKDVSLTQTHRGSNLSNNLARVQQFNDVVAKAVARIKEKADEILAHYFKHPVELTFIYKAAIYKQFAQLYRRSIEPGYLAFDLKFLGRSFPKYEEVLNEAKLSAVALSVYLASLIEGIPKGNGEYPRILVLDDVLIGLDMNNRLPVLEILQTEFAAKGWQLILLTHDKIWYDYAAHQATSIEWECYELYADICFDAAGKKYEQPLMRKFNDGAGDFLKRAQVHIAAHDDKAAAMYARAGYEQALKKYCDDKHLPIPFYKDAKKLTSDKFLKAVEDDLTVQKSKTNPVPAPDNLALMDKALLACSDIRLHRQQVLNPLSHSSPVAVSRIEVEQAIQAVENLIKTLKDCKT